MCYWILPSIFKTLRNIDRSTFIFISPLEVLMKDKEQAVSRLGVKAIVGSDASEEQMKERY